MAAAERELRALQRELLLTRAAAERAELAAGLAQFDGRTRTVRRIAGTVLGIGAPASTSLGAAASVLRLARRQPWIIPTAAKLLVSIARSRAGRWTLVAGAAAAGAWWLTRRPPTPPAQAEPAGEAGPPGSGPPDADFDRDG